ncbi:Lrp/AsnC family transcriptional regulator [Qipengyuania spongiae]|uniref:Lrp/AsnC family transcriptional regulator n=1 Tax=Qipengyuania spongiae TaxID=2909673 RepID=A0ABY5T0F1_9SPHN|nr:Lrp/AsnC family transcriptional regulator [Qipengyuania spongiae]UVI40275.1 Lrp/AsnC family transcriptional regulator [Qipengyuania spongiae]
MDAIDYAILRLLQEDASLPVTEIAARINLSQTPTWRRIQKLEQAGVIDRRVALLDPQAVGRDITVFVDIETRDHSSEWLAEFARKVASMPEVMEVYRMAGEIDYTLRISVGSMADFDAFYRALIDAVPLKNVTSRFAMERIKYTTAFAI